MSRTTETYWQIQFEIPAENSITGLPYWDAYTPKYPSHEAAKTVFKKSIKGKQDWSHRIVKVSTCILSETYTP
jgi:hypothetical protein